MNACAKCHCSPCTCSPAVLNNPQIIGGIFDGPTVNGATINGGVTNQQQINGAQIDCTTRGCTMPDGICDASLATTAFVCTAIDNAISGSNPAFCAAIGDCLAGDPTIFCPTVAACINSTPGIINNTSAFGFNARATTGLFGVVRYATGLELQNGSCLLAIDPCTLIANWNTPAIGSAFWNAFVSGVSTVLGDPAACAALAPCGFAPLASPTFTGIPAAPTASPGTSTTQIATTAFVALAIGNAISAANPAFCPAVTACGGGGGGGGGGGSGGCTGSAFAAGSFAFEPATTLYAAGCTIDGFGNVTFTTPRANTNYSVVIGTQGGAANPPFEVPDAQWGLKTTNGFRLIPLFSTALAPMVVDFAVFEDVCVPGVSGPGNFASITFTVTTDGFGNVVSAAVAANYGCTASFVAPTGSRVDQGPVALVTFSTPQPDTRWTVSGQMIGSSAQGNQDKEFNFAQWRNGAEIGAATPPAPTVNGYAAFQWTLGISALPLGTATYQATFVFSR